jgi:hypothetical protein
VSDIDAAVALAEYTMVVVQADSVGQGDSRAEESVGDFAVDWFLSVVPVYFETDSTS